MSQSRGPGGRKQASSGAFARACGEGRGADGPAREAPRRAHDTLAEEAARTAPPDGVRRSVFTPGEVAEWLKAHAWKACLRETVTWVRIPPSPPEPKTESAKKPSGKILIRTTKAGTHGCTWVPQWESGHARGQRTASVARRASSGGSARAGSDGRFRRASRNSKSLALDAHQHPTENDVMQRRHRVPVNQPE